MMQKVSEILDIPAGIISIIGSGGKTTMLRTLAEELSSKWPVLLTTTTHFMPFPEYEFIDTAAYSDFSQSSINTAIDSICFQSIQQEMKNLLSSKSAANRVLVLARSMSGEKKLAAPLIHDLHPFLPLFRNIIVEADGSRQLPLKAHASYEPVIPPGNVKTILIVGASGFHQPVFKACHRPEIFQHLTGCDPDSPASPSLVGKAVQAEHLADIVFLNQIDNEQSLSDARQFASELTIPVIAGSLHQHCFTRI